MLPQWEFVSLSRFAPESGCSQTHVHTKKYTHNTSVPGKYPFVSFKNKGWLFKHQDFRIYNICLSCLLAGLQCGTTPKLRIGREIMITECVYAGIIIIAAIVLTCWKAFAHQETESDLISWGDIVAMGSEAVNLIVKVVYEDQYWEAVHAVKSGKGGKLQGSISVPSTPQNGLLARFWNFRDSFWMRLYHMEVGKIHDCFQTHKIFKIFKRYDT